LRKTTHPTRPVGAYAAVPFLLLKATLHNYRRKLGPGNQDLTAHPDFLAHLRGRVAHVSMLSPARGRRLMEIFDAIAW